MQMFMRRNEFFPTDRELEAVFTMFDRDGDGKISYSEFLAFVNPKIKVRVIPVPEKIPFSADLSQDQLVNKSSISDSKADPTNAP
jgi:Ca2+-binding EF-hand superfamily protein